jgi:hypothetical protein
VLAAAGTVAAVVAGGSGGRDGPWPDAGFGARWPTFATLPASESGAGGLAGWDGSFRRCVRSVRFSYDFACEYGDDVGHVGYACFAAAAPEGPIEAAAIKARVAPGDPTYAAEKPTQVCDAALAYSLSLG